MSVVTTLYRFLLRGGTAAALASLNETPLARELIVATNARNFKLGDGATAFNSLPWLLAPHAAATGTNTITATYTDKPVLFDGMRLRLRAAGANTGAVTFNPNSLGAVDVKKNGGVALAAGDISAAGHELLLTYRSSVPCWELMNPALNLDTDGALAANSDGKVATQKATKTYVDNAIAGGGAVSVGSVINSAFTATATVASNASTTIPFDNTIPQNTEGDAYASLDTAITPYFAGSILDVEVFFPLVSGSGTIDLTFALFRDSGADALASTVVTIDASNFSRQAYLRAQVSAGSTSATTFKVRWGRSGSTGYINRISSTADIHGGILRATMTIREIKQ